MNLYLLLKYSLTICQTPKSRSHNGRCSLTFISKGPLPLFGMCPISQVSPLFIMESNPHTHCLSTSLNVCSNFDCSHLLFTETMRYLQLHSVSFSPLKILWISKIWIWGKFRYIWASLSTTHPQVSQYSVFASSGWQSQQEGLKSTLQLAVEF